MKRHHTDCEKISVKDDTNKDLISKICRQLIQLSNRKKKRKKKERKKKKTTKKKKKKKKKKHTKNKNKKKKKKKKKPIEKWAKTQNCLSNPKEQKPKRLLAVLQSHCNQDSMVLTCRKQTYRPVEQNREARERTR